VPAGQSRPTVPLRRYLPFLLVAMALLLAILVAPSRPPVATLSAGSAYPPFDPSAPVAAAGQVPGAAGVGGVPTVTSTDGAAANVVPGAPAPVDTLGAVPGTAGGVPAPGAVAAPGLPAAPRAQPGATAASKAPAAGRTGKPSSGKPTSKATAAARAGGGAAAPQAGAGAGDTTHCVGTKQFDIGPFTAQAPPCVPRFAGNNGGATSQGVTADTIKVVYYREADSPVVKAYLQNAGLYSDPAAQAAYANAFQTWANGRYELYGRKLQIVFRQSPNNCSSSPPDDNCYRKDARAIAQTDQPFAVFYENSTNVPGFFDELSKLGIVNWGGWHFSDTFNANRRPFHYDVFTGGDQQAETLGDWWCRRLAGHPAKMAGDPALAVMNRKAGILVQDIDLNVEPAQHLADIINACGGGGGATVYKYSPDTGTSQQQAVTLATQMHNDKVTSVLYFCDPIAPQFVTASAQAQAYKPEEVIVGSGLLDNDVLAQAYQQDEWAIAIGISDATDPQNVKDTIAQWVWANGGGAGTTYASALLPVAYLTAITAGLQAAGPNLNPGTFERGVLTLPPVPSSRYQARIQFGPGDYTGVSDFREVVWNRNRTSPLNGKPGSWDTIDGGQRYTKGASPAGDPSYPVR